MKVFISVDMEGITGVTKWNETNIGEHDYEYFRKVMTEETNAAIEGALAAGATEIVVRDSHGSACNLLPELLHQEAKLLRNWSGSIFGMMEGINESFDAAMFVGYHAKANTPNATLKHTMNGKIEDLRLNGVSLAEAGLNALIAGHYGVPMAFVAGDKAIGDYCRGLFGDIESVAVKEAIGTATLNLHPAKSRALIRAGVTKALQGLNRFQPYRLTPEYFMEIQFKDEHNANRGQWYPGAERVNATTVGFRSKDFIECLRFFDFVG